MPDFRVVLSDEARANVGTIYEWIAERSAPGASRWYRAFLRTLDSLTNNADRCPVAPESRQFSEVVRNVTFRMRSSRTYRVRFAIQDSGCTCFICPRPRQDWVDPPS